MAQAGMIQSPFYRLKSRSLSLGTSICSFLFLFGVSSPAFADELALIPDSAAGIVRVPDMPAFCQAWKSTTLSAFANDESMKAFVQGQRARAEQELLAADLKVGIKLRDLLEIASGEAVIAWLPFKDPKRPFSIAVIADTSGLKGKAKATIDQVDLDMKAAGATRKDVKFGNDTIRVYSLKAKPGQLKLEQVAIMLNDDRIIASDRETVVTSLLEAAAGNVSAPRLIDSEDYMKVVAQSDARNDLKETGPDAGVFGLQWFARPLAMAKIVKEAIGIDRGRQVNIVNLLERQGFDAIRAAGGNFTIGHRDYDLLHYGFVLAPPVTDEPSKYKLAARMLQFPNTNTEPTPGWIGKQIASYTRLNWNMQEAFWAAESLINDLAGDEIFRDMFDGIRDDEDGPRIDVEKKVIPYLGEHLLMLTDNQLPASETSERLLVAIKVTNVEAMRDAVRRAMEVEPDASLIEGVPGTDVYRVLRTDEPADFDSDLFDDLGLGDEPDPDAPPPLLNQWAISVVTPKDEEDGYLVFSSHPELLIETANRITEGAQDGLRDDKEFKSVSDHLIKIGGDNFAMKRVVRLDLALRVKYMLLREAKLRDSDSLLTSLIRRAFDKDTLEEDDPLGAKTLPPFEQVEKYFRPAGTYMRTVDDGWFLNGFLLK
jgi:hypothetical protein